MRLLSKPTFIGLVLLTLCLQGVAQDKPNVLWITFEDTSPHYIGCYGNEQAKTPNIDRLASEGVMFNYAYANGTVCSPARSTLITGVHTESMGTGHHRSSNNTPSFISGFPTYMRQEGYYTTNNQKTDYNTSRANSIIQSSWNQSNGNATWKNRPSDAPFFAVFNIDDSHQTRTMHYSYTWYEQNVLSQLTEDETVSMWDIDMPPYYRDTPEMRKNFVRVYNSISLTDKKIGNILNNLEADGLMDETIIFIYADHGEGMPRGKGTANGQGHQVPFIIWFPEKYKDLSPWELGKSTDEVISFVDLGPTMLSLVGADIPDYMEGRPFLGGARVNTTDHVVFGARNNVGESPGMERTVMKDNFLYSRIFVPDLPETRFMVYYDQSDISRLSRNDFFDGKLNEAQSILFNKRRPIEFLYNIEADPWEVNNLADDPGHQTILTELRSELYRNMRSRRDAHLFPNPELVTLSNPYNDRLSDVNLPIADVMDVVETIGIETEETINQQITALSHSHQLVRYWALMGLRMQRAGLDNHQAAIKALLNDSYPMNQVQAAFILYKNWEDSDAKTKLEEMALSDNREIATETVGLIQYLYEGALEFRETLTAVIAKNQFYPRLMAQTILHYFDGGRLSYYASTDSRTASLYDPYYDYDFELDFTDKEQHNDLVQNSGKLIYDGVRGSVAQVSEENPTSFGSEFFLGSRFGLTFWIKPLDMVEGQRIISLSNNDTTSQVNVSVASEGKLRLSIDGTIFETVESNLVEKDQWNYISLSYGFEKRWKLGVNGASQISEIHPYDPEFITRGLLYSKFTEADRATSEARIDDLTVYHFDFDAFHNLNAFGSENVPTGLSRSPYHFYGFEENGVDSVGNSDLTGSSLDITLDNKRGNVLTLGGTEESSISSSNDFKLGDAFTISTWFKMNSTARWQGVTALGDENDFVYFTPYAWNDLPYIAVDGPDNREFFKVDDAVIPSNQWTHLAITYINNSWTAYIDGEQVATFVKNFDPTAINQAFVGRYSHADGNYANALIDDYAVFHVALTEGEINLLLDRKVESVNVFNQGNTSVIRDEGHEIQMLYTVQPSNASLKLVEWSIVGDTFGASINDDGLFVSGNESGNVEIRATAIDGSGVSDTYQIQQALDPIQVSSIELLPQLGITTLTEERPNLQIVASISPSFADNKTLNWSIEEPDLGCTISEGGMLSIGDMEGTITVIAQAADGSEVSDSIDINIDLTITVAEIELSTATGITSITEPESTLQILASIAPSEADNQELEWEIVEPALGCSIDETGVLSVGNTNGTITILALAKDGSEVSGSIQITLEFEETLSSEPQSDLALYPNPTTGLVWVVNAPETVNQISIYDLSGQLKKKINWNKELKKVDLNEFENGVYYLILKTPKETLSQRVVIRK